MITPDHIHHILSHLDVTFCEGDKLGHISSFVISSANPMHYNHHCDYLQVAAVVHNELQQNEKFLSDFKRSVGYLKVT